MRFWSRLALVIAWLGAPLSGGAQESVASYYGAHDPAHLRAVETHHLPQAIEKVNRKDKAAAYYAWDDIEFILRRFPDHPQALSLATKQSLRMDERKRGEALMIKAIQFSPRRPEPWIQYGIFLHRWGDYEKAVEKYKKALELRPRDAEALYNLGLAYLALGRYEAAREAAIEAYALGYPLPGLRNKLQRLGHWGPRADEGGGRRQ